MEERNETSYHVPVLLNEVIEYLAVKPAGVYVDCTFGGGGHSKAILQKLNKNGKLVAFDQDADAKQNLPDDERVVFVPHNFRHLQRFLRLNGINEVDGVLADLGVSSYQFDERSRGFSIRFDASLDMRMDQRGEKTAADVLNNYSEAELHKLFEQYGEVTNSKTLAKLIVEKRKTAPFQSSEAFRDAVFSAVKGNPNKYFAQVYQALRMEVNEEVPALKEMLQQLPNVLKKGGRAAVITFHSIEDRLVKTFFQRETFVTEEENPFVSVEITRHLKKINKKPIVASESEVRLNPRARSAKLRVAEKM
ncbi:16S rRNA (cytosine(1402)-N(4))-methyltransferase RsmH [Flavisolibacter ginsenosidimutans]|uniref:Ribosomal RNA small subunit methyltransferase H n=1 Tax=Flavisolibacter ginsenosidimutans TaxID=661481 RepID=A0A5B8UIQ7_9BACT|nr:16S rRNA (cytosine(1402)-N(4))-methyltransferase RsmH [Flavisolibacter ginsenosidimutans]QEC56039.1 16S rRNA (cytosine(1402)-N(4))-methyltransferase RsmH [Flavisolibacter ginsenosidimutans]